MLPIAEKPPKALVVQLKVKKGLRRMILHDQEAKVQALMLVWLQTELRPMSCINCTNMSSLPMFGCNTGNNDNIDIHIDMNVINITNIITNI